MVAAAINMTQYHSKSSYYFDPKTQSFILLNSPPPDLSTLSRSDVCKSKSEFNVGILECDFCPSEYVTVTWYGETVCQNSSRADGLASSFPSESFFVTLRSII